MAKTAKYEQIIDWINARIESGELKTGDRLETEQKMSAQFGISRQTVRHALGILEQKGILERVQGSGSYVKYCRKKSGEKRNLSKTVTIISSYVNGYIFPRILESMVQTLQKAGYSSRIMFTGNHVETERSVLKSLLEEGSRDPMIVEPVMSGLPSPNLKYYRELKKQGIPILFFHSFYPELDIPYVTMDDEAAGRLAVNYLISQGHRKIGGIFKADDGQGRYRYKGYLKALYEADIPIDEKRICWIDTLEQKNLPVQNDRVMERLEDCTACICYNDEVAHMLTKICLQRGIRIPEDLSLVSVDDSELARLNTVPLTSVIHPMERMGKKAAENLLCLIEDPQFPAVYEFKADIKIRESVLPVKNI